MAELELKFTEEEIKAAIKLYANGEMAGFRAASVVLDISVTEDRAGNAMGHSVRARVMLISKKRDNDTDFPGPG